MRELEQEKILVVEIQNSDQKYLSELKNTISEQKSVITFLLIAGVMSFDSRYLFVWYVVLNLKLSAQTSRRATPSLKDWKRSCRSLIYKSEKPLMLSKKLNGSFTSRRIAHALRFLDSKVGFQFSLLIERYDLLLAGR